MRRMKLTRAVTVSGLALVLVGVTLVGVSTVAAARVHSITFSPNSNIGQSQGVLVSAKGFARQVKAGISECNVTPGEPTVIVATTHQQEPVGCRPFTALRTTKKGGLPNPTGFTIESGPNGPPALGLDSAGIDAATDAQAYPCPPTAEQVANGGQCVIMLGDVKGQSANEMINYNFESTTTTATSTTSTTTTTTHPCTATSTTATGVNTTVNPNTTATMTVNPGTCIVNGTVVSLSGSGFVPSSLGEFLQCNSDPDQPTVLYLGNNIPVGCTNPLAKNQGPGPVDTSAAGDVGPYNFTVLGGTVGPPCGPSSCTGDAATDSAGRSPVVDAADYPCPPTAAQVAAGDTCEILFGDNKGDAVRVPISFF